MCMQRKDIKQAPYWALYSANRFIHRGKSITQRNIQMTLENWLIQDQFTFGGDPGYTPEQAMEPMECSITDSPKHYMTPPLCIVYAMPLIKTVRLLLSYEIKYQYQYAKILQSEDKEHSVNRFCFLQVSISIIFHFTCVMHTQTLYMYQRGIR